MKKKVKKKKIPMRPKKRHSCKRIGANQDTSGTIDKSQRPDRRSQFGICFIKLMPTYGRRLCASTRKLTP